MSSLDTPTGLDVPDARQSFAPLHKNRSKTASGTRAGRWLRFDRRPQALNRASVAARVPTRRPSPWAWRKTTKTSMPRSSPGSASIEVERGRGRQPVAAPARFGRQPALRRPGHGRAVRREGVEAEHGERVVERRAGRSRDALEHARRERLVAAHGRRELGRAQRAVAVGVELPEGRGDGRLRQAVHAEVEAEEPREDAPPQLRHVDGRRAAAAAEARRRARRVAPPRRRRRRRHRGRGAVGLVRELDAQGLARLREAREGAVRRRFAVAGAGRAHAPELHVDAALRLGHGQTSRGGCPLCRMLAWKFG